VDLTKNTDEFGFLTRQFIQLDLYKKLRLLHAYEISRHDEEDHLRVFNTLSNRWLLYHGTTATAALGIMRRGLQILKGHSAGFYGAGGTYPIQYGIDGH
jgi:hypothetical protein